MSTFGLININFYKVLSLFSIVRGYNIFILIIAQYMTAKYIFDPFQSWKTLFFDINFLFIVLATALSSSAGYIINNFFDSPKDKLNRPNKFFIENLISKKNQFLIYIILNFLSLIIAAQISSYSLIFFSIYILGIYFYSNFIKRSFWLSNFFLSILMIMPFLALSVYFKNFNYIIFCFASYLFFLIFSKDLIKDLESLKGDIVYSYKTIPAVYDSRITKIIFSFLILIIFIPVYYLIIEDLGLMSYYFILCIPFFLTVLLLLWLYNKDEIYLIIHNLLKAWILIGILSISLLNFNY
ncbi:MAG: ubiquinone biosynthesis protein UbiA [Flavobacteriaceae bacterium]|nr:ubiquinone biosynthesis protein UbiA [Flavobacteriaceae bacterium]|tara:strand:+ start:34414 stop:35301 length:888 start_codon:yes stop_codon:yes gene_type:complete